MDFDKLVEKIKYYLIGPSSIKKQDNEVKPKELVSDQIRKENIDKAFAKYVGKGWRIQFRTEFSGVISAKKPFSWGFHIFMLVILGLFSAGFLSIFWLFVMLIIAVTSKEVNYSVDVDEFGEIHYKKQS